MTNEPVSFSGGLYLVWSEPDEGSYNYQLYRLRYSWNGTEKVAVPAHIVERIRKKANTSYPIMVVQGNAIDNMIDEFATGTDTVCTVTKSFGLRPRRIVGTGDSNWGDSVGEFLAFVQSGGVI